MKIKIYLIENFLLSFMNFVRLLLLKVCRRCYYFYLHNSHTFIAKNFFFFFLKKKKKNYSHKNKSINFLFVILCVIFLLVVKWKESEMEGMKTSERQRIRTNEQLGLEI